MALLDIMQLEKTVASDSVHYSEAQPFPHILLEDFLPLATLKQAIGEFPAPGMLNDWRHNDAEHTAGRVAQKKLKLGYSNELKLSDTLRRLFHELNSGPFMRYLKRLTSVPNLIPDPHLVGEDCTNTSRVRSCGCTRISTGTWLRSRSAIEPAAVPQPRVG